MAYIQTDSPRVSTGPGVASDIYTCPVADDDAARTLRASADSLKQLTDKMCQEHSVAGRELAEHAQTVAEFIELQRKNRSKVCDLISTETDGWGEG